MLGTWLKYTVDTSNNAQTQLASNLKGILILRLLILRNLSIIVIFNL